MRYVVFTLMAQDFTRGLIGEINKFFLGIAHAEAWVQTAQKYKEGKKLSLLAEFADPHLELSVSRPYSLRNHFIFAVVHLLHLSNQLKDPNWKDDLPFDRIGCTLLDRVGLHWRHFQSFKENIKQLNGEDFKRTTSDFRNRLQHQFRGRFYFGLTPIYERTKTESGVSYVCKVLPPLDLDKLMPNLYKQHQIAMELFQTYWQLVTELRIEWDKKYMKTPLSKDLAQPRQSIQLTLA